MSLSNKVNIRFTRRTIPRKGPFSTEDYNAGIEEISNDLTNLSSRWNTEAYVIFNSLPRGTDETRWSGATNVPDALSDGLDGDTIFVSNDATSTTDGGLFWYTSNSRPSTLREALLAIHTRIDNIYEELNERVALLEASS